MARLELSLACGAYDLVRALADGGAQAPGVQLNVLTMPSPERHGRMLRHQEFDICEQLKRGSIEMQRCNAAKVQGLRRGTPSSLSELLIRLVWR